MDNEYYLLPNLVLNSFLPPFLSKILIQIKKMRFFRLRHLASHSEITNMLVRLEFSRLCKNI